MKNRKGVLRISHEFIQDINTHGENMLQLFSNFVPIRVENHFSYYEYYGYSPLFDQVEEGCVSPTYDAVFTYKEETDSFDMEFNKIST